MAELVPLRVILRKGRTDARGQSTVWPDFSQIAASFRGDMPAAKYIDTIGLGGWHYDKISNIGTGDATGTAMALTTQDFASAAITLYPLDCSIVDETTFEDHFNNKAHAHEPDNRRDTDQLSGLMAERNLRVALGQVSQVVTLDAEITRALDPNDITPGLRGNPDKIYANRKAKSRDTIRPDLRKP